MSKNKKRLVALGIVLVFAVVVYFAIQAGFASIQTTDAQKITVVKETLVLTTSASGKIVSSDNTVLNLKGTLTKLEHDVGDFVEKGEVIATTLNSFGQNETITASVDGLLTQVPGQGGQVFVISNPKKLEMNIQITERDIPIVAVDQVADIYVEALNQSFPGKVDHINYVGFTQTDYTLYTVTLSFDQGDAGVYLGMSGSANIKIKTLENVLSVPSAAIIEQDGKRYVMDAAWLDNQNKARNDYFIEVTTGAATIEKVEIVSGLSENQEILVFPTNTFSLFSSGFPGQNND